jgi:hypothetical protein
MSTAKQCWKKYYWAYEACLEPIEQRPALQLGKIVHAAFEMYYKGFSHVEVGAYISRAFDEERGKVEMSDVENVDIAAAVAIGMWDNFPKDKDQFQEIYPEKEFSVKFGKVTVEGIMDGLVKKDNRWWVREMKTTSLNRRQFAERMGVSEQASMYVWAAKELGFDVQGIMYDALHKPLLRKGANESCEAFCNRIRQDYKDRQDVYFQREYVYRSKTDIDNFVKDMKAFRADLFWKRRTKGFYRNHGSCVAFNSQCQYQRICFDAQPDKLTLDLFYKQRTTKENQDGKRREGITEQASAE